MSLEVKVRIRIDFIGLKRPLGGGLWDARFPGMLRSAYHHFGDS